MKIEDTVEGIKIENIETVDIVIHTSAIAVSVNDSIFATVIMMVHADVSGKDVVNDENGLN